MKNLYKAVYLLLFTVIVSACHQDNFDNVVAKNKDPFLLRNTQKEILKTVDPQILAIVRDDLLTANRKSDAAKLLKTYDIVSGDMFSDVELPSSKGARETNTTFTITQDGYSENIGWQYNFGLGSVVGTTNQGLRLEAFKITTSPYPPGAYDQPYMSYQAYMQDIGWGYNARAGEVAGTTGQARRIEAIRIYANPNYAGSVAYRAYVQDMGWLNWVGNSGIAGTTGQARRLEAFQLNVVVYDQP